MAGREHVFLGPVEEEDDVVLEGLWGLHEHLQHLQHDCTGDCIVAGSWALRDGVKMAVDQQRMICSTIAFQLRHNILNVPVAVGQPINKLEVEAASGFLHLNSELVDWLCPLLDSGQLPLKQLNR